jgi:Indolepyruvate ferredoxin oxidoreductase, alpha and beta subunits
MHEVRHNHDFENRKGAWQCLKDAKRNGIIHAMGVSTHHADVAEQMASENDCDILFPLINKDSLGIRYGANPGTREQMASAIQKNSKAGKGVFAMKAFGGGNLTGTYMESLDYVSNLPGISSIMIGFGSNEEVDQAVAYAEGKLPDGFQPDVGKKKIHIDPGDCEGCKTCIKRCPNKAIFFNESKGIAEVDHDICLTCGYCAPVCPVRAIIMY